MPDFIIVRRHVVVYQLIVSGIVFQTQTILIPTNTISKNFENKNIKRNKYDLQRPVENKELIMLN